jgi:putative DNA primase/helicase
VHVRGKRFLTSGEIPKNAQLDEARIKKYSGGDDINGRHLFSKDTITFKPQGYLWLYGNFRPKINDVESESIWRRVISIPFNVRIPDDQKIEGFEDQLLEERNGIFKWMVNGAIRAYQGGQPSEPSKIQQDREIYRREMDILGQFIEEYCTVGTNEFMTWKEFERAYKPWCERSGFRFTNSNDIGKQLQSKGLIKAKDGSGNQRGYKGISITQNSQKADSEEVHTLFGDHDD